jgi:DNA-binding transcriptional LysR family regulator
MSLTKQAVIDQITVTENGVILYREATRIMEDGNQISQTYHRSSLTPAQDLTGVPANVVAICNAAWTAEVIAAYQAQVAAQATNFPASVEPAFEQSVDATQPTDPAA